MLSGLSCLAPKGTDKLHETMDTCGEPDTLCLIECSSVCDRNGIRGLESRKNFLA